MLSATFTPFVNGFVRTLWEKKRELAINFPQARIGHEFAGKRQWSKVTLCK